MGKAVLITQASSVCQCKRTVYNKIILKYYTLGLKLLQFFSCKFLTGLSLA